MDKKEFYEKVDAIVRTAIAARIEAQTALDDVAAKASNRRMYSVEHINKVLEPQRRELQRKIVDIADIAKNEIEKITSSYVAELEAENHLNGGALTEDAQLLSVGVKLRDIRCGVSPLGKPSGVCWAAFLIPLKNHYKTTTYNRNHYTTSYNRQQHFTAKSFENKYKTFYNTGLYNKKS